MSFESLYQRLFQPLFRYVHRWTGDRETAADITQEAFVRYLRADVPEDEARPWLFRVAGNLVRDRRRRRERRARLVQRWVWLHESDQASPEPERSLEMERAREALSRLSERDRQILLLREEGLAYRQIAEVVGVAPGSVGTLLARALRRFKEAYGPR